MRILSFAASCLALAISLVAGPTASAAEQKEQQPEPDSHLRQVLDRGTLIMICFPVMDSTFVVPDFDVLTERGIPLSELRDADAYSGSDVELMRGFAAFLGVSLEIHPITTDYGDLIQAVVDRVGDLGASSLTVSDAREEVVDFSVPLDQIWAVVAGPLDSPMISLEELSNTRVRGMAGSSQVDLFGQIGPQDVELTFGDYALDNYNAVLESKADYMLMDSNAEVGQPASDDYPEVKVIIRLAETNYGVAFPDGSDLRVRFNEYLLQR